MVYKFYCSACGEQIIVSGKSIDDNVVCESCSCENIIPKHAEIVGMNKYEFYCSNCGKKIITNLQIHKGLTCMNCNMAIVVPENASIIKSEEKNTEIDTVLIVEKHFENNSFSCSNCGAIIFDDDESCWKCSAVFILDSKNQSSVSNKSKHSTQELMKKYNISKYGEFYQHGNYRYEKLEDAINNVILVAHKNKSENTSNQSKRDEVKSNLKIKWLEFWIYFSLPLGFISLLLFPFVTGLYKIDVVFPIIYVSLSILYIFTNIGLYLRKLWGWYLNWFVILIGTLLGAIPIHVDPSSKDYVGILLMKLILLAIFWLLPNIQYWKKRKILFK